MAERKKTTQSEVAAHLNDLARLRLLNLDVSALKQCYNGLFHIQRWRIRWWSY